jgi:DNA-binding Lrp family transcriptional regulator
VKFDLSGEADSDARSAATGYTQAQRDQAEAAPLTAADKALIRVLQQDLAAESEPYAPWAAQAGVSVAELLAGAQRFIDSRQMRRFSAVLRHREAGISANAMGVWAVPPEQQEAFGTTAAGFAAVSHCYLRRSYPDWPYTMFTMVHAPTPEKCQAVLAAISAATGIKDYGALFSTKEYKKVRVKYFTGDVEAWERGVLGSEYSL